MLALQAAPRKESASSSSKLLCFAGPQPLLKQGYSDARLLVSRRRQNKPQIYHPSSHRGNPANFTMTLAPRQTKSERATKPERTIKLPSSIRPRHVKHFSVPFEDLVIRAWQPRDRLPCMELIKNVLSEYRLGWDPVTADRDVVDVEAAYSRGEFWVIEDTVTAKIVGTAAFYEVPHRGREVIEIRKMYLSKNVRGLGLGSFLLSALEQRGVQLGYKKAIIETASVLKEACALYEKNGYKSSTGLETDRCDIVLEKPLIAVKVPEEDHIEAIDMTRGWSVTWVPRKRAYGHRLLGRAVVVLVECAGRVLVHKRSMKKSTYPGRIAALVTGCVDWLEDPLDAAKREVFEEVGLRNLDFVEAFAPYISKAEDRNGQRIWFHPFVARGEFGEGDFVCDYDEVESAWLMKREDICEQEIGGSLWQDFREHGL